MTNERGAKEMEGVTKVRSLQVLVMFMCSLENATGRLVGVRGLVIEAGISDIICRPILLSISSARYHACMGVVVKHLKAIIPTCRPTDCHSVVPRPSKRRDDADFDFHASCLLTSTTLRARLRSSSS